MSDQVTPSRMNLTLYKQKTQSARKGHELLKKKCDALKAKFRTIMIGLIENKEKMGNMAEEAFLIFAKAILAAGEFHQNVRDAIKHATIKIDMTAENVAGVMLPLMKIKENEDSDNALTQIGMERGGAQINNARLRFKALLVLLIQIAGLQTSFVTLDQVIKVTNRRVNALEYVVIPKFIDVQNYILQELDEQSKEEFFRLKKVLSNKKRDAEIEIADRQIRLQKLKQEGVDVSKIGGNIGDDEDQHDDDIAV